MAEPVRRLNLDGARHPVAARPSDQRDAGRRHVGHEAPFLPTMRKTRDEIGAVTIGEVQAVGCRGFVDYGGDASLADELAGRRDDATLLRQREMHAIKVIRLKFTIAVEDGGIPGRSAARRLVVRRDGRDGDAPASHGIPPMEILNSTPLGAVVASGA